MRKLLWILKGNKLKEKGEETGDAEVRVEITCSDSSSYLLKCVCFKKLDASVYDFIE